jgi:hypothetical protein
MIWLLWVADYTHLLGRGEVSFAGDVGEVAAFALAERFVGSNV